MHVLRRTTFYYGSRVNLISPFFVKTTSLPEAVLQHIEDSGVQFSEAKDAAACLLRILSDRQVNGHSFFISPRKWVPKGYIDLDVDDFSGNSFMQDIQKDLVLAAPVEAGLFV